MTEAHIEREIQSQPECWRRAADVAPRHASVLPQAGERVAVVGCGTSWFIAQAYARLREDGGHGETDAFAASEMPEGRSYDRILAITRSGTTTEVLDLLKQVRGTTPTVAITAVPESPIADVADTIVSLDFADEESVVQTRFATTALMLLRASLGDDVDTALSDLSTALTSDLHPQLLTAEQITFLGQGWSVGLANEAALKMREAAQAWTESYPAMDYRHGPISVTTTGRVVWILGAAPDGLVADVERTGGHAETSSLDPLAELVRVQRLALATARAKGLDPDQPRNLTRSVILDH
ncbi:SIS domain-containing protein [Spiractinospora alimapuensis]|uniref:SIS domain-containing protein n=1 Tax=Spiractinospora alimapuensis TaxID=2820884 RepID=UPI001F2E3096|nr:SIS domain-containing protein [Spiractinospora alimapuensis]QVQ53840.1 SIS domain-containing protein [Spiractinospora alimapuensis]